uniref:Ig-like domain-containing protein n=1 Tax=Pseudonaja textilis TaxID=8673 RepID=A0A670YL38_PSETE
TIWVLILPTLEGWKAESISNPIRIELLVVGIRVSRGKIQDYHVFWFQQKPSKSPAFILKHGNDGNIDRSSSFDARFVPIRDADTNAYVLQIQKVQTEDSATYFCLAEGNYFQIPFVPAREPQANFLHSPESSDVHAICVVEDFYPGLLEIKWSAAGKDITEGVTSGSVILNGDGTYTTSSILNVSRNFFNSVTPIQCSVSHESSGAKIERKWPTEREGAVV